MHLEFPARGSYVGVGLGCNTRGTFWFCASTEKFDAPVKFLCSCSSTSDPFNGATVSNAEPFALVMKPCPRGFAHALLLGGLFAVAAMTMQNANFRTPGHRPILLSMMNEPAPRETSAYQYERRLTSNQLLNRWDALMTEASQRFQVPKPWICAVMRQESGGRTMLGHDRPIVSHAGAIGLMQVMPGTYDEMAEQHKLGADPFDARNNILAGTAYLRWLHKRYGYPRMFAAYNAGPGRVERGGRLPAETRAYVGITRTLHSRTSRRGGSGEVDPPQWRGGQDRSGQDHRHPGGAARRICRQRENRGHHRAPPAGRAGERLGGHQCHPRDRRAAQRLCLWRVDRPCNPAGPAMKHTLYISALAVLLAGPAQAQTPPNPFASPSSLPYQAPRFDLIRDSHYQPAFEAGMKQQIAEIDAIAGNRAAPSFDNTIVALERSGRMLDRVNNTFFSVVQANTNPALDKVQTMMAPKLAAHMDAIFLNPGLFARVKALYDRRQSLKLDGEGLQTLTLYYRQFVHAGANLNDAGKTRLKAINSRAASLETSFQQKLVAGAKAGRAGAGQQGATGGPDAGGNRQCRGRRQGAGTEGQVCPAAAEHHAAAAADVAVRPRRARKALQQQLDTHGKRRRQRHPRHHPATGCAARRKGQAAGLRQLCRLCAVRPDGGFVRGGAEIHRPAGAGDPRQGGRRGQADPGRDRQGGQALCPQALGLAALCREGAQGTL